MGRKAVFLFTSRWPWHLIAGSILQFTLCTSINSFSLWTLQMFLLWLIVFIDFIVECLLLCRPAMCHTPFCTSATAEYLLYFFFLLHRNLFNNKFVRIRLRHCQMLTCCQIYTKCALHFNKFKYSWIICNDDNKYSEPFKLRIFRLGGKKQPNPWHGPTLANLIFMEYRHSHGVARDCCNAKYAKYGPAQSSVYRSLSLSLDHLGLIPMDVPYIPLHEASLNEVRGTNHE